MDKKSNRSNQQRQIRKTSPQSVTMRKHLIAKRRYSQQSTKILCTHHDSSFLLFQHANTTTRLKHRTTTSFRPLATSTPYEVPPTHSLNNDSPHATLRQRQEPLLTPPAFCSTPKQTRRRSSTIKRKLPIVISQRRLQFTTHSQSTDESKRLTINNVKIWLL
ncbi:unnamed protein product [Adineta ricciae]|uniref:Uncharacterized protein n=2 Tax=Adineta ricciae TaxID=249248 RepID=A0A814BZJ6_ADIRI|nr:unnamed protein product [Adineta ricciae]